MRYLHEISNLNILIVNLGHNAIQDSNKSLKLVVGLDGSINVRLIDTIATDHQCQID